MLIEFSVANYRSFREKVTLSMVAANDRTLEDTNTFAAPGKRGMRLVKSAAIYGANASGKSNLLKALRTMHDLVRDSASRMQRGDPLPAEPFKLDPATLAEPSLFEIVIATADERYIYGFNIDRERVHEEWLSATRLTGTREAARMLFERSADGDVDFGDSWQGERATLAERVRPNALVLSVAVQGNNETARPVFDWFAGQVRWAPQSEGGWVVSAGALMKLQSCPRLAAQVAYLVREADVHIDRLTVRPPRLSDDRFISTGSDMPPVVRELAPPALVVMRRDAAGGEVGFDLHDEESRGTQQLVRLALPWLAFLREGGVLLIDEFESSLHPHIARQLLKSLHAHAESSQLIFTTHDTNLLDPELLRRDQIWFTERTPEGATSLYSLWDFKPRAGENFQKGYLAGRYGAVPFLGDWSFGPEEERATED